MARALIAVLAAAAIGCTGAAQSPAQQSPPWRYARFLDNGGRVDWHGPSGLIAYDAIVRPERADTEVFVIAASGGTPRCVTCASPIPKGFIGQPAWHPDGEHLVVQAESAASSHTRLNHMSFGIDNDLWQIGRDGSGARRIWATPRRHAVLHPHFSADGSRLVFAERVPTGRRLPRRLARLNAAVDGENQWEGWRIRLADVVMQRDGRLVLSNVRALTPAGPGFYETHGFTRDGGLIFSFTPAGRPYSDDIYVSNADGSAARNLIRSPSTWDEHGAFSPSGAAMAFISSRADRRWAAPRSRAATLRTELFLRRSDGAVVQVTDLNRSPEFRRGVLVSDFAWDRTGRHILFQVAPRGGSPQLWMVRFDQPQ